MLRGNIGPENPSSKPITSWLEDYSSYSDKLKESGKFFLENIRLGEKLPFSSKNAKTPRYATLRVHEFFAFLGSFSPNYVPNISIIFFCFQKIHPKHTLTCTDGIGGFRCRDFTDVCHDSE